MSPVGLLTTLLLISFAFAQEKVLSVNAQVCDFSYSDPYKPVQMQSYESTGCSLNILRPANETTRLIFSMLELNPSAHCSKENITVLDENLGVLGVLCPGSPKIAVFESPGDVYIRMYTNSTVFLSRAYFLYYSITPQNDVQCGGSLQGSSGIISSPNYPNRHSKFTFCVWNLEAPKNTRVKLSFSEIFIEPDAACRFDFIALYDGPDTNSPILNVLCGRTVAEVESSSNHLTLMFSADYANSYFGFSTIFTALPQSNNSSLACSGESMTVILTSDYINSLGYTANELSLIDNSCIPQSLNPIVFEVPYRGCGTVKKVEDHTIYYTNTIFAKQTGGVITKRKELQFIVTCELDSNSTVEVMYMTEDDIIQDQKKSGKYDVSLAFYDNYSPLKGLISTELDTPYFIELNETAFLQATVKSQDPDLTVFVDTCFISSAANFHSPTYDLIRHGCIKDDTYQNLGSGSGYARFSFNAFKFLDAHPSVYIQCQVVVCDINDGRSRCNQGCVTRQRRDLGSTVRKSNAVLGPIRLKPHSEYDAAAQCDTSYTDPYKPVQILSSENADCSWNILRPANETTRVIFSLLELNPSAHCSQENITVLDENLGVLGVLCPGSPKIAVFESPGKVYIRLYTDSTGFQRRAYFLYYSVTPQNDVQCGESISDYLGIISSPNYPGRHSHFTFCVWNLEVPKNTKVKLSFLEIFIEPDAACRFDFIALYDGPDTNSPLLDVLCGQRVAEVESSSNHLTLMFSADYANSYFGFSTTFKALPQSNNSSLACSGESMTVVLTPEYINSLGYNANELSLIDKSCVPQSMTPIVFEVPYWGCGTIKKVEDHTIYYTNTIFAKETGGVITRRKELQFIVTCVLDSNSTVEIMYVTEDDIIQEQQESGKYDVSLAFYDNYSPLKGLISTELDTPYFIELNETAFLQATLKSQDPDLTVFVDTCFASSAPNFLSPTYDLIRRGCIKDDTYQNLGSGSGYARFSFSAFKFLDAHPSVYIQCQVVVCDVNDGGSRCNQGCVTRQRRDLGSSVWKSNAVLGPIRLKRHSESDAAGSVSEKREEAVRTDNSSVYFLGIPVLVVNVLLIALVLMRYARKEPTGYRYHQVATQ